MRRTRVIPVLLLSVNKLVKSVKFKDHKYVGDPINAVKIFNEKEVDELAILDINASREGRGPDIERIAGIASEAFMPVSYGGGITRVEEVRDLLFNGIEKVILNKAAVNQPDLISRIAERFGVQSVVVSIDVKKNFWGKPRVYTDNGQTDTKLDPVEFAKACEAKGAGEIFLQMIEREGGYKGYDIEQVKAVSSAVSIPVIACGGAGKPEDFLQGIKEGGASAVAAGSMFVFQRPHNAVLISYPSQKDLKEKIYAQL